MIMSPVQHMADNGMQVVGGPAVVKPGQPVDLSAATPEIEGNSIPAPAVKYTDHSLV